MQTRTESLAKAFVSDPLATKPKAQAPRRRYPAAI